VHEPSWKDGLRLLLAASMLVAGALRAAEGEPALHESEREVRYVELQPAFVTNYGFAEGGRLKYVKTDVSVRVSTQEAEMATRYHLPALRNALVLLLSRQDEAAVSTSGGREMLKAQALEELNAILEAEEGRPLVDDLLFTNFVVQR
jgi:flagellar FliL protein